MVDDYSTVTQSSQEGTKPLALGLPKIEDRNLIEREGIQEGIWAWDVPNDHVYWSNRIYDMLGIPQQESPLTNEAVLEFVHLEDRENLKSIIQASLITGNAFETRFRMGQSPKSYQYLQLLGRTYLDDQKQPIRMSGLVVDVTERKKVEESLQKAQFSGELKRQAERITELEDVTLFQRRDIEVHKSLEFELKQSLEREKLTKHLIQLMSLSFEVDEILQIATREIGSFFGVDRCGIIQYEKEGEGIAGFKLSAQYCLSTEVPTIQGEEIPLELVQFLKAQPNKKHPLIFLNVSNPAEFPPSLKPYLESYGIQSALIIEIKYRNVPFGWLTLYQCTHPRVWAEPDIDFLEILVVHIGAALYQAELYQREKQAKQEAEEANRQKSKILSYVSHDFKNPLDSIKRFIGILEKDQNTVLPEKHREFIGYIAEGIYQLRNMVTDILDKARLEEGRIAPSPEWIDIPSFIDELSPIFHAMASQRNVEVNAEIQPELAAIKADPTHLRQILINLLSNAVKYNRINGKVFLKLRKSEDRQFIVIEVQDTGLGISPEKIPHLFTEYFRADLSQSNPIEGTGLGLSFIKKLIELSDGTIKVESIQGEGSTFTVYLPRNIKNIA